MFARMAPGVERRTLTAAMPHETDQMPESEAGGWKSWVPESVRGHLPTALTAGERFTAGSSRGPRSDQTRWRWRKGIAVASMVMC